MRARLRIVTGSTPGLRQDALQLQRALGDGWHCDVVHIGEHNAHGRWDRLRRLARPAALRGRDMPTVFMETLHRSWMRLSRRNAWVPNLEWVDDGSARLAPACDAIWCKTGEAMAAVRARGLKPMWTGFSSRDRHRADVPKERLSFLHLPGRSHLKGTEAVVRAWLANPCWPPLTVVVRPEAFTPVPAPHIRYLTQPLDDEDLTVLMNRCGVHLCPSVAEGFGHYIVEAMSTGAVTVTTDGPPMNEHVQAGSGVLVRATPAGPLRWGTAWQVTPESIAAAVEGVLGSSNTSLDAMGEAARGSYLQRHAEFTLRAREAAAALAES